MSDASDTIPFKRLTLQSELLPFDCGNTDLTDYFFNSAKRDMQKLLSVTYYLEAAGETILFFTLSNDKISESEQKICYLQNKMKRVCRYDILSLQA